MGGAREHDVGGQRDIGGQHEIGTGRYVMGAAGAIGIAAMNIDVTIDGRAWKIALERSDQARMFTVTIKGKSRHIDASWIDDDTVSLVENGTVREIRLHPGVEDGAVTVQVAGQVYGAVVVPEMPLAGAARAPRPVGRSALHGAKADATGTIRVGAPMPGRVVRVLVDVGDRVHARQPVVVVEAMKMENELRTSRDGVVKEILVAPGAAVESGAILVVVDPC
jgi:biotin carboxyl carrier protein